MFDFFFFSDMSGTEEERVGMSACRVKLKNRVSHFTGYRGMIRVLKALGTGGERRGFSANQNDCKTKWSGDGIKCGSLFS